MIEMTQKSVQNSSGTTCSRRVVSLPSFEHFMASFLWSIRLQTMKKSGRLFFFYNNTSAISFIFRCRNCQTKCARVALQIASFSWSVLSSKKVLNQSARENSGGYCKNLSESRSQIQKHAVWSQLLILSLCVES